MDRIILYESANLRAAYVPAADRARLVVTFASWLARPDLRGAGFGEAFLRKHGIAALHVTCASNAWYQYPDIGAVAAVARALGEHHGEVITYGQSMGGYAALQFLGLFGAARALAYAPQYSVDRSLVPFETRWADEAAAIRFLYRGMSGPAGATAHVFYDPHSPDRRHAALIAGDLGAVQAVPIGYSEHRVTPSLMQMGLLAETTLAVLRGTFSPEAFTTQYRARRRMSAVYLHSLALRGRWVKRRIALCRAALRIDPAAALCLHALAELLLETGELGEAEAAVRRAIDVDPSMMPFYRTLSVILDRAGRRAQALDVLGQALGSGRADAATYRFYANTALGMGLLAEAEQALRTAIALAPQAHRSHIALSGVLERLGRREEALVLAREAWRMAPGEEAYRRAVLGLGG